MVATNTWKAASTIVAHWSAVTTCHNGNVVAASSYDRGVYISTDYGDIIVGFYLLYFVLIQNFQVILGMRQISQQQDTDTQHQSESVLVTV